jgi:ferric-dicitrate binding protein FerR (iron transport regulator)
MDTDENRLWNLLALKLSGEAAPEDLIELQSIIESSSNLQNIVNRVEIYWNEKNELVNDDETEEERFHLMLQAENKQEIIPNEIIERNPVKSLKTKKYHFVLVAASVLLIAAIAFLLKDHFNNTIDFSSKTDLQQVYVKPGSKSKIILPDGTVVHLNSSSRLAYHNNFNKNVREVELDGEAYFDVTKDAKHPFIVHTSNIDIKVLGTLFNVKCYAQDATIETTLLRGSIEVYNKNDASAPKVILRPNEKLVFTKKTDEQVTTKNKSVVSVLKNTAPDENISISNLPPNKPDSLKDETSWVYNRLVIDDDDFSKMAKKMERWYGVKIEIQSPELQHYHFKGIFENETIEQALNALQLTVKFRYKINNDVITITR